MRPWSISFDINWILETCVCMYVRLVFFLFFVILIWGFLNVEMLRAERCTKTETFWAFFPDSKQFNFHQPLNFSLQEQNKVEKICDRQSAFSVKEFFNLLLSVDSAERPWIFIIGMCKFWFIKLLTIKRLYCHLYARLMFFAHYIRLHFRLVISGLERIHNSCFHPNQLY